MRGLSIYSVVMQLLTHTFKFTGYLVPQSFRGKASFSTEILNARREWQDIYIELNEKAFQPRILYPARLSFKMEGEIRIFSGKEELKDSITTKSALQEFLKGLL